MLEKSVVVKRKAGLQARPAALFVQEANKYSADVFIEKDGRQANAKSIMGIMSLAVASGKEIKIIVKGNDEEEALAALVNFVTREE